MKTLMTVVAVLFSLTALANPANFPTQFPTESGWAKAKVRKACGVQVSKSDVGSISKAKSTSGKMAYVYTVKTSSGELVGKAAAYSDAVWVKATCQN